MTTVIVVEDNVLFRATVCAALRDGGMDVVADTASAADALDLAAGHRPQAAVLDLDLGPGPTGADVAVVLRDADPSIGIVVLTGFATPAMTGRDMPALPPGIVYMTKDQLTGTAPLLRAVGQSIRQAAPGHAPG